MASAMVSLGSAELLSFTSGTTLKLHSHACFASSEEDAEIALRSLTNAALKSIPQNKTWITKGNEYALIIKLTFEDGIDRALQAECARAAAASLQNTRVWSLSLLPMSSSTDLKQLWQESSLRVSAIRQSYEVSGSSLIELHFDYSAEDADNARSRVHKLVDGVPLHDVSSPPGITAVECESVCLKMQITSLPSERGKLDQDENDLQLVLGIAAHTDPELSDANRDDEDMLDSLAASHTASGAEQQPGIEASAPRRSKTDPAQQASKAHDGQSYGLKRTYSANDSHQRASRLVQLSDFLDLFEAAFGIAVSPRPKRRSQNVAVIGMESLQHLSQCIPSLWSSGHLAELSNRAVLLPTISRALSNVGSVNPQSRQLRSKFGEILRRSPLEPHLHDRHQRPMQLKINQNCLSVQIWSLAQHFLSNQDSVPRFCDVFARPNAERSMEPEPTSDDELDGHGSDTYDFVQEYEPRQPERDAVHADLPIGMEPPRCGVANVQSDICMTAEDDMLSLCGSHSSAMDLELEMGLDLQTSDLMYTKVDVDAYPDRPTDNSRLLEEDLEEILPV
ncbi:hypothetical protein CLAFUW4_13646 [Fulvia fulva]|uniref:uncharacterized protein n=1 Tax=Passalora fulva TaxID=5499 RepID=UPI0028524D59|nr:uncharacterized protein CLAFUR5_20356 [Fulvia fulva]KAK4610537.1 hypothetical protein CLAFUR4_13649 [Fulvia fulva]KAK4610843.1 hypothetical protein CLAFUR0_13653 [Fulvia fulva]WMI39063.1 hypothetical protein CLAFUR5_20356 [Fulvia fulva]WPV22338.1 hypothetical protein CLAFUW4_13646 [Fulvia fulva]WPV36765.1 hypothetical protein CLAFUW7_13654 [Fulvia fulva]